MFTFDLMSFYGDSITIHYYHCSIFIIHCYL